MTGLIILMRCSMVVMVVGLVLAAADYKMDWEPWVVVVAVAMAVSGFWILMACVTVLLLTGVGG